MTENPILVVEDDEDLRFLAKHQLKKLGFKCETAKDGEDALEKIKETKFSLILMDVMMPVLNGCDATLQIREIENQTGLRTTIIAMTAVSDKQRCLESGMDDYIFKPVLLESLGALLKKWL